MSERSLINEPRDKAAKSRVRVRGKVPFTDQKRRSRGSQRELRSEAPHFPQPDLNEAGRAADAARDVMEQ